MFRELQRPHTPAPQSTPAVGEAGHALIEVMQAAYLRGWISTRDGNASFRHARQPLFHITPSGVRKQHLRTEDFVAMRWEEPGGRAVVANPREKHRPSGEVELHLRLLQDAVVDRCVLHLHPTYTIAALFAGADLQAVATHFPEIYRYTRVGPSVPAIAPITTELATASCTALGLSVKGDLDFDIVGLDRHGVVAVASDPWTAFEHVERLEHICQIALAAGLRQ